MILTQFWVSYLWDTWLHVWMVLDKMKPSRDKRLFLCTQFYGSCCLLYSETFFLQLSSMSCVLPFLSNKSVPLYSIKAYVIRFPFRINKLFLTLYSFQPLLHLSGGPLNNVLTKLSTFSWSSSPFLIYLLEYTLI